MTSRILVVMVAALLALAGCGAKPRPAAITVTQAQASLRSLSGVESARLSVRSTLDGFTRNTPAMVKLQIAEGFAIAGTTELADYLIRILWSIDDVPPTRLVVLVTSAAGSHVDLSQGAREGGWKPIIGSNEIPLFAIDRLDREPVKSKLGPWPGPVPPPPVGAIVPLDGAGAAQRSRSANAWIASTIPAVSNEPSGLRVK